MNLWAKGYAIPEVQVELAKISDLKAMAYFI